MNTVSRVTKNSAMLLLARVPQFLSGFILLIFVPRYLGTTLSGDYAFVRTLVTFFIYLTYFGVQHIIIREIARDKANAYKYLDSALFIRLFFTILVICIISIIVRLSSFSPQVTSAIYITIFTETFLAYSLIFTSVFRAYEKMAYETILQFLSSAVLITLLLFAVFLDMGFIWIFVVAAIANFSQLILGIYICYKKFVRPKLFIKIDLCKHILRQGISVGIALFFLGAISRVDVLIIKALRSSEEVAFFYLPHNLLLQIGVIAASFSSSIFPVLSRMTSLNDSKKFIFAYEKSIKFFLLFTLPVSMLGTIFSTNIITLLFGKDFLPAALSLQILIWFINFMFIDTLSHYILISLNRQKYMAISALSGLVCNCILDLILIPLYGYLGASVATLISYFVMFLVSFHYISKELGTIKLNKIVFKPVLCTLFMGGTLFLLKGTGLNVISVALLGFLTYGLALLFVKTFMPEEIAILKSVIKI